MVAFREEAPASRKPCHQVGPLRDASARSCSPHSLPVLSMVCKVGRLIRSLADTLAQGARRRKSGLLLDCLVRSRRLELPRAFAHNDLNVARLPIPPRPLNCEGPELPDPGRQERAISKALAGLQAAARQNCLARTNVPGQPGFQPISAATADLGTSVTASLMVTLSPGPSRRLGGITSHR